MSVDDAVRFFGLDTVEELEALVLEQDIDVDVDPDDAITAVAADPDTLREALFERHRRRHGYRPDDPEAGKRARTALKSAETKARNRARENRERLRAKRGKT